MKICKRKNKLPINPHLQGLRVRKIVGLILIIICFSLWFSIYGIQAAEYMGSNIDGTTFNCSAYSYSTGKYYYGYVDFSGNEATLYFRGRHITLTLDDEEIEDPHSISAYDYNKGVYWELDVDGID